MSSPDKQRPTLKTIAELTGYSLSTVSLSLRDGSQLKKTTRDKVAEAAEQIGYVPNRAGVRLRTGRTNVLALVLAADVNNMDFTRIMIQGIGAYIHGTKYHLNVIPEFERSDPMDCVRYILSNRSADGVILTHTSARDPRVQLLMDEQYPFVSHGRTEFVSPHAYHDFHAERFIELAVGRHVEKGRTNLLLAAVDNGTTNYSTTVSAYSRQVSNMQMTGNIVDRSNDLENPRSARELGIKIAKQTQRPDGIICNNELTAVAIISALQGENMVLGKDYDLICKQTTEILPMLYPRMDTIAEDLYQTGRELAKLLISSINAVEPEELQTLHSPITHWRNI
ncbi:MAG: LacI family transcriptional regulator [Granulosicoccus sp.]